MVEMSYAVARTRPKILCPARGRDVANFDGIVGDVEQLPGTVLLFTHYLPIAQSQRDMRPVLEVERFVAEQN